ncbi:MAG TPA: hypothetical protein DHV14_02355 [Micrococcales bacterium]|nr:hypothetical protein [Micrococcales bacterium]
MIEGARSAASARSAATARSAASAPASASAASGPGAAVAEGAAAAAARSGEVSLDVRGEGVALADAEVLARVVRNLVANGVRHAVGRVRIEVSDGELAVDDDGAGIAVAERERVFERFVRLDAARERDAGGSGLGLAIARELAREQGGDVVLADSLLGGLRAVVTLPVG